jgi:hypothetical protein
MSKIIFSIFFSTLLTFNLAFAQETITLTTYYPSPYGSYAELRAQRMAIGPSWYNNSVACWSGSCTYSINSYTDLVVERRVGIGTSSPGAQLAVSATASTYDAISGNASSSGTGVYGYSPSGAGVYGYSPGGNGVYGVSYTSDWAAAVFGYNLSDGIGVFGGCDTGRGVQGAGGLTGVVGCNGAGTYCSGISGAGVFGDGLEYGVYGLNRAAGKGVYGKSTSAEGVYGESTSGKGVYGKSTSAEGVYGESTSGKGVYGKGTSAEGVYGYSGNAAGVYGESGNGPGVHGKGATVGVFAEGGWQGAGNVGLKATSSRTAVDANGAVTGVIAKGGTTGIYAEGTTAGDFKGNVKIDGTLSITGPIVGADVAEDIICPDCAPSEVVVVDPQKNNSFKKSEQPYDNSVAGIISNKPSLNLNIKEEEKSARPLALVGIVKCKVIAENGPIKSGDLLVTSSKPGYAMRADLEKAKPGMILGKALKPLDKGEGEILVLIK